MKTSLLVASALGAGVAVVILGAVTATVFLPALLSVLGPRIEKFRVRKIGAKPEGTGFWHRVAVVVMKRPIPVATIVVALLAAVFLTLVGLMAIFAPCRRIFTRRSKPPACGSATSLPGTSWAPPPSCWTAPRRARPGVSSSRVTLGVGDSRSFATHNLPSGLTS